MKTRSAGIIVCLLFLVASVTAALLSGKWEKKINLKWDVSAYYLYLPAALIYQDLFHLRFYSQIDTLYRPSNDFRNYAITPYALTGKKILKYPVGVALFELPAFALATLWCSIDSSFPADGWSEPYQLAIALCSILFTTWGLWLLFLFLRHWFPVLPVVLTLIVIGLGTNLFLYSAIEPGLSHPYLFFLYALIMYATAKWYRNPDYVYAGILGFALGMTAITRPTDLIVAIFPVLWLSGDQSEYSRGSLLWLKHWRKTGLALMAFCLPVIVQLIYWKAATGYWLYYSYEEEGFIWGKWHILDGLFSYRKGWFIYTPLALLGFLGWIFLYKDKRLRFFLLPSILYFAFSFWVVFSWWMWWYGGSFGSRVMIQSLALLAFPMCAFFRELFRSYLVVRLILIILLAGGIFLNLFQSWQYHKAIIHWDSMNKAYYWRVFGKTSITSEDLLLLQPPSRSSP